MSTKIFPQILSVMSNFYRRTLPKTCISFSSNPGKELFRQSLLSGNMECYFKLASQFRTQDEPAFCGLSTLVMSLNSLEIDPGRVWKGPWRWYHEEMLDCCISLDVIKNNGITFEQFSCIAKCNGLKVEEHRYSECSSISEFRELCQHISKKDDEILVLSYSRKGLEQTGDGHFAPVGGYNSHKDMLLVFDTARFKYPPHWVRLPDMWSSMSLIDKETSQPRGYFVLSRDMESSCLLLLTTSTQMTEYLIVFQDQVNEMTQQFGALFEEWIQFILKLNEDAETKLNVQQTNTDMWSKAARKLIDLFLKFKGKKPPKFPLTFHGDFGKDRENYTDIENARLNIIREIVNSSVGKLMSKELSSYSNEDLQWLSKEVFEIPRLSGCSLMLLEDSVTKMTFLISSWLLTYGLVENKLLSQAKFKSSTDYTIINDLSNKVLESELTNLFAKVELTQLSNKLNKMHNCKTRNDCCHGDKATVAC